MSEVLETRERQAAWEAERRANGFSFDEPVSYDLYRQGRISCEHVFGKWDVTSHVDDPPGGKMVAVLQFKAECRNCDARVGRRVETVIHEAH